MGSRAANNSNENGVSECNPQGGQITITPDADGVFRYPRCPRVTVDGVELEQLRVAAESWWQFWGVGKFADLLDREVAYRIRATSRDLSGSRRWAGTGPSYAALQRIRERPAWVRRCRKGMCWRNETVYSLAEWREPWWCGQHADTAVVA